MLVKNWREVYKSFAVWFPIIATILYQAAQTILGADVLPPRLEPVFVAVAGALGWIIKQPYIKK